MAIHAGGGPEDTRGGLLAAFLLLTEKPVVVLCVCCCVLLPVGCSWCFFRYTVNPWSDWSLFYFPLAFMVLVGIFFMSSIMYRMIESARLTGSAAKTGFWKTQLRPMIFILTFVFIFAFIFAYRYGAKQT